MPACPAGHESASTDFCDVCGIKMAAPPSPGAAATGTAAPAADSPLEPCPRCGTARSGQFCEACGYDFAAARSPASGQAWVAAALAGTSSGVPPAPPSAPAPAAAPLSPDLPASSPGPVSWPGPMSWPGQASAPVPVPSPALAWTAVVAADRGYYDGVIAAGGPAAAAVQFPAYCPERRFALTGSEMRIGRRSPSRGLEPEIDLTGPPADPGISRLHAVLFAEPGGWAVVDPGSENGTIVNGIEIAAGARVSVRAGDRIHLGAWTVITISADPRP